MVKRRCYRSRRRYWSTVNYTDYTGDNIDGISSFSFEIPELTDWFLIPSVEFGALDDGTAVICELLTPTIALRETNPKIYIKYELKELFSGINNRNEMTLKKVPRVFVEFEAPLYGVKQNKAGAGSNDSRIEKEQKREAMYRKYPMHRFSFCSFGN